MNKRYALQLTAISPVHIGTGEDFEPTNYVIDKNEEGKPRLYEFDELAFYAALDSIKQEEFNRIVAEASPYTRFKLYDFIARNKTIAKKIATVDIQVLPEIADEYFKKIGQVVQKEGKGKNVFNDFTIAKTYVSPNTQKALIPGSSIKGAISTAVQEMLYKKLGDYGQVEDLMLKPTDANLFKDVILSDAIALKSGTFIGYAENKKRNRETSQSIKTRLQAINTSSEFALTIVCKGEIGIEQIQKSCNDHYLPIFKSIFDYHSDEYVRRALKSSFVDQYENWLPKANQFLLRIGKHSGARAVTVDGIRQISIMQGKGNRPKTADQEGTVWLRGGTGGGEYLPYGWVVAEITEKL
ncbi:MAG: RAMP superfamily CRISPR-associated protein [Sulfuricurvum sp.]|nr:RAMP superfamily CRISPR-associated protein [Sulfuricurvum sp.]